MKILYLLRHGKADRPMGLPSDKERPLLPHGVDEVARMARKMVKKGMRPDLIISSTAVRALETARTAAAELGYPEARIASTDSIYAAEAEEIGLVLRHQQDDPASILVVGHNPGLEDLAGMLARKFSEHLPTGGVIALQLAISRWSEIEPGCGTLISTFFP